MIVEIAVSLLAVLGFAVALWKVEVVPVAQAAVATAMSGLSAMVDRELDDDAKEVAVRRAAFGLLGAAGSIALRFAVVLAAAAVPVVLAAALGLAEADAVTALMLRLDYILVVSAAAIVLVEVLRRFRRRRAGAAAAAVEGAVVATGPAYADVDQFLHRLAFSSPAVLRVASRLEDGLFGAPPGEEGPPIFVTSLARGGTTALLNALAQIPEVATHTYRDMPFVTAPLLWDRLAGGRRRAVDRRDRAHGDGLTIDLESPEAFEEVVWKMFWPEKFGPDRIALWSAADRKPAAERFLRRHMAKILQARRAQAAPGPRRYCSKNNAHIGRLAYLAEAFAGCRLVMPLRRPERHAASLLRQHRNFLALQAEDAFVRRYMDDIGHFEFGLIHRPLAFPGFDAGRHDPMTPDYWLDYWIHAFREVRAQLAAGRDVLFVTQDSLRQRPQEMMEALAARLGLDPAGQGFAAHFRSTPDRDTGETFAPHLVSEASDLYETLAARAI